MEEAALDTELDELRAQLAVIPMPASSSRQLLFVIPNDRHPCNTQNRSLLNANPHSCVPQKPIGLQLICVFFSQDIKVQASEMDKRRAELVEELASVQFPEKWDNEGAAVEATLTLE